MLKLIGGLFSLTLSLSGSSSFAVVCQKANLMKGYKGLVHQVLEIDDPDRRTEEDFAAENNRSLEEVKKRYGSTGDFRCPGISGSANLVLVNNVIVTSAHLFQSEDCRRKEQLEKCSFIFGSGKTRQVKKIKKRKDLVEGKDIGRLCPSKLTNKNDWMVLTLEDDVVGAQPYSVEPADATPISENRPLVAVNAFNNDWFDKNGNKIERRSIGNCNSPKIYRESDGTVKGIGSNCDTSRGSSGGAALDDRSKIPVLLGVLTGSSETPEQEDAAILAKKANKGAFDKDKWLSYYVPVTGKFLNAILAASAR